MRILWIKTELLHPVDKGGRIRTYQMLRSLTKQHHVTYLCLDDGTAAPNAHALASEYCNRLETVPFDPPVKGDLRFFFDLLVNLFSPLPYAIARYRSAQQRARIADLAHEVGASLMLKMRQEKQGARDAAGVHWLRRLIWGVIGIRIFFDGARCFVAESSLQGGHDCVKARGPHDHPRRRRCVQAM